MTRYERITEWATWSFCCGEGMAICPDCGADWCVFCEDECACEVFIQ